MIASYTRSARRIEGKFGVAPEQYADFKSLAGDESDHIAGTDKVGPKTAAMLLSEFGSLEKILQNAEQIRKPSVRESIFRNTERLRRNYKLIKLGDSVPLPFPMQELQSCDGGMTTNEVLQGIELR